MEYEKTMTDEITCPHCDYEFSDSYENIPRDSDGETSWIEECPECEKKFNVSFDCRNIDNGYTSSVLECDKENHNYKVKDKLWFSKYAKDSDISKWERIEVCTICNKYKFIPVKEDGSDFTPQELLDFKIKKRLSKKEKYYFPFDGVKTGSFKSELDILRINLSFKEPEGNVKVWVDLCRFLISKGYKPQPLEDFQRRMTVRLKRGIIEVNIHVSTTTLEIQFYQNEIMSNRKKGDGIYEFHKYKIITDNSLKIKMRAAFNACKKYLVINGFTEKQSEPKDFDVILKKIGDLNQWQDPKSNDSFDRDKKPLKTGDFKYFYDGKVLKCGTIYWNNGNQWYVMCGGTIYYTSHYSLFDYTNELRRKQLSHEEQIQRIYTELSNAEKAHNYDRCKVLWKIISEVKLYNVYSIKHGCWWGKNNNGYTSELKNAGVYTEQAIKKHKSYYDDGIDSKAILIEN